MNGLRWWCARGACVWRLCFMSGQRYNNPSFELEWCHSNYSNCTRFSSASLRVFTRCVRVIYQCCSHSLNGNANKRMKRKIVHHPDVTHSMLPASYTIRYSFNHSVAIYAWSFGFYLYTSKGKIYIFKKQIVLIQFGPRDSPFFGQWAWNQNEVRICDIKHMCHIQKRCNKRRAYPNEWYTSFQENMKPFGSHST